MLRWITVPLGTEMMLVTPLARLLGFTVWRINALTGSKGAQNRPMRKRMHDDGLVSTKATTKSVTYSTRRSNRSPVGKEIQVSPTYISFLLTSHYHLSKQVSINPIVIPIHPANFPSFQDYNLHQITREARHSICPLRTKIPISSQDSAKATIL